MVYFGGKMGIRTKLRKIQETKGNLISKIFDYSIQVLILISIGAFTLETFPDNSPQTVEILNIIELIVIIIFSIEYCVRLYLAKKRLSYIFSFYGLIDLLSIIPFYLSLGLDLRSLRALRMLRIIRALKLVRYNKALTRFGVAARLVKEEIILFLLLTLIIIFLVSCGIHYFEYEAQPEAFKSVFHSMWWTIVTLTTVGYGDVYPITLGGKMFTFLVLIIGLGVVTVPAGLITSALQDAGKIKEEEN